MKKFVIIIIFIGIFFGSKAQNYLDTICWVWIENPDLLPLDSSKLNNYPVLDSIFQNNHVAYFKEALPFAKNPILLKIYEIRTTTEGNIDSLKSDINSLFGNDFDKFSRFESDTIERMVYDPSDWMWQLYIIGQNDWLWHLKKTECDYAWDITKGSEDINIAILDYNFDVTHPDLENKFSTTFDPYDNSTFNCNSAANNHGTEVASFAGAETDGGGQLASAGFNTMIIPYHTSNTRQVVLQKALHACNVMGANIIISCAGIGALGCNPDTTTGEDLIVKEILDNGTAIIWPAGNGTTGHHCGDSINGFQPFYPFNPIYDNRIIVVSGTGKDDKLYYYVLGLGKETTWSYFSDVDICAPGHDLMGAEISDCNTLNWPYFGGSGGTSFATPIAAGIAALVLSVKSDLTPAQLKYVLKSTTDPVADEADYSGMVGDGRINAYKAVCYVYNNYPLSISNVTFTGNKAFIRNQISIDNTIFDTNSVIEIKTGELIINGPFEANTGGSLTITNYTCP